MIFRQTHERNREMIIFPPISVGPAKTSHTTNKNELRVGHSGTMRGYNTLRTKYRRKCSKPGLGKKFLRMTQKAKSKGKKINQ